MRVDLSRGSEAKAEAKRGWAEGATFSAMAACQHQILSDNQTMSTVAEIENALQTLPVDDAWKVADWLQQYLDEKWDKQIDADIAAGRLDKLAGKSLDDHRAGRVKPFDEVIEQP